MPIPTGFDNTVRVVLAADPTSLSAELTAQNTAGYLCTDVRVQDSTMTVLLFVKNNAAAYGYDTLQKLKGLIIDQATLDADKATEELLGYYATGIFLDPSNPGSVLVLYAKLTGPSD